MKHFVEGEDRTQGVLLPEFLDDYVTEDNPVRAIDVFADELDLAALGFEGAVAETTGRPAYHPATMLKIYVYSYVNQIQSSRRLERETARNVEMMWLTGRLTPDFKTIADFRKDNGPAIRSACRQFVALCGGLNLFTQTIVAIDGSQFKHEAVLDAMQERLDRAPGSMRIRRQTAEHPFATIKAWMGATHFRLRTLEKVGAEMSLHVLAYNLKRMSGRTLNPVITIGEGDETMKRSDMGHCPVPSWIQNGISRDRGYRPAPDIPLHRGSRKPRKRHRGV